MGITNKYYAITLDLIERASYLTLRATYNNQTALSLAISQRFTEVVTALIKKGVKVDLKNFLEATHFRHKEIAHTLILVLVKRGEIFSLESYRLDLAFSSAIFKGYKEVVQAFLKGGAIVNLLILVKASKSRHEEIKQLLSEEWIKRGPTVLLKECIRSITSYTYRPEENLRILIETKREMDFQMYGESTFSHLTSADCKEVVRALIKEGASPSVEDLKEAISRSHKDLAYSLAEALIVTGTDLNLTMDSHHTLLTLAVANQCKEAALRLMKNVDFNMNAMWKCAHTYRHLWLIAGLDKRRPLIKSKDGSNDRVSLMQKEFLSTFFVTKDLVALLRVSYKWYAFAINKFTPTLKEEQRSHRET